MKKFPNSVYALLALSIITTGLLSGCNTGTTPSTQNNTTVLTPNESTNSDTSTTPNRSTDDVTPEDSEKSSDLENPKTPDISTTPDTSTIKTPTAPGEVNLNNGRTKAPTSTTSTKTYKDNTYSESTSYQVPSGTEKVTFKFIIENDAVTNVELTTKAANEASQSYQDFFIEGVQQQIIGKKLSDVGSFSRVNGSSLTPIAFNKAITQLKKDAKA